MKQYGDITKLSGYDLDPVDLIVGGSPCQDLSVAGKRAGLEGERSGLFMEMIRLIKEMREKTNGIYPRFALWENVPGAFSSNKGKDFSAVLGEFARIAQPNAPDVPCPEDGWTKSGVLLGSDWSIAWRTHDAQYWGVPQRRRRISLVADFRGQSAAEILFERKGLSGDSEQSEAQREDPAGSVEDRLGETGDRNALIVLNDQGGGQMDVTDGTAMTLRSQSHGHEPVILNPRPMSMVHGAGTAPTLGADDYKEPQIVLEERESPVISFQERSGKPGGGKGILIQTDHVGLLSTMNNQMVLDDKGKDNGETVDCLAGNVIDRADTAGCNGKGWTEDVSFTLNTIDRPAVYDPSVHHGYREFGDVSETVRARYGTGGNNQPLVVATMQGIGDYVESDKASALKQRDYKDATDLVVYGQGNFASYNEQNIAGTLRAHGGDLLGGSENLCVQKTYQDKTGPLMASGYEKNGTQEAKNDMYVCGALNADDYKGANAQYVEQGKCQITNNSVRRLTPLECERLQGYPDGWTDIPGAADSKRYKALGNSIALPFWEHLARRFVNMGDVKTIGSLFDGIGGFPLCFYRAGAKTLWTSEIEPFPIQVVHERFDEDGNLKEGWK